MTEGRESSQQSESTAANLTTTTTDLVRRFAKFAIGSDGVAAEQQYTDDPRQVIHRNNAELATLIADRLHEVSKLAAYLVDTEHCDPALLEETRRWMVTGDARRATVIDKATGQIYNPGSELSVHHGTHGGGTFTLFVRESLRSGETLDRMERKDVRDVIVIPQTPTPGK